MATRDTYTQQEWKNLPSEETPVSAERLAHIEQGIKDSSDNRSLKDIYNDTYMKLQTVEHSSIHVVGDDSVVHGKGSCAPEEASYSGGEFLTNTGKASHAEGVSNIINGGTAVHLEGASNTANGTNYSHEEGYRNTLNGSDYSHMEGQQNTLSGAVNVHMEGRGNIGNNCEYSHIEGLDNKTLPNGTCTAVHLEGAFNEGRGSYSHIEGNYNKENVISSGGCNHMEGSNNIIYGNSYTHIGGYGNYAGTSTKAAESGIHMEGMNNRGFGRASHIEGEGNKEDESGTHVVNHIEGSSNILNGRNTYVHMSGNKNQTQGTNYYVHISGDNNVSKGYVESGMLTGSHNILSDNYQFVGGKYCQEQKGAVLIGGGTMDADRKNILFMDWSGNFVVAGDITNGDGISLNSLKASLEMISDVESGENIAKVFDTKAELDEWLALEGNAETLKTGQDIYIKDTGTPDYWWDGAELQVLETEKVFIESMTYDETIIELNSELVGETNKIPNIYAIRDWCKALVNPSEEV